MPCMISPEQISACIAFHGHECPGLAIGIRAAELALRELGPAGPDLVAVCETDMCGVDAIMMLTNCTVGKGNLVFRDLGKMAFTFHRRGGPGFRAVLRPQSRRGMDEHMVPLMRKDIDGRATDAERQELLDLRKQMQRSFMAMELEDMFDITKLESLPPRPPSILESLVCDTCGERVMESRTRRFQGRTLCIPCFEAVEQKR
ncbi:formylmethanofuran dehydrogenase subunit E [Humidesulfovibrio mexicanus]|uniref:Formylmethanofuran dehydrogenase subunit E n=1 Tax=Humidesulfovibrio mexicanus TaxID=147047 RepID=A0A238Z514_9BACT|nr:FmdE family protein [Humidesulfovibrio mexicanus]SNR78058.1 formylmethanofuran dehydrogenase subunit E [Humidesulfovibrio mexicanus]